MVFYLFSPLYLEDEDLILLYRLHAYFIIKKLSELARRFFDYTDFEIWLLRFSLGGIIDIFKLWNPLSPLLEDRM